MSYHDDARALKQQLATLAKGTPEPMRAFEALLASSSKDGALPAKFKELIALSIAIATRCEGCIVHHIDSACNHGATREKVAEALAVTIAMGGGPSTVYSAKALALFDERQGRSG